MTQRPRFFGRLPSEQSCARLPHSLISMPRCCLPDQADVPQDLIREDQIPLRQIGVAEIMKKIADDNVSYAPRRLALSSRLAEAERARSPHQGPGPPPVGLRPRRQGGRRVLSSDSAHVHASFPLTHRQSLMFGLSCYSEPSGFRKCMYPHSPAQDCPAAEAK